MYWLFILIISHICPHSPYDLVHWLRWSSHFHPDNLKTFQTCLPAFSPLPCSLPSIMQPDSFLKDRREMAIVGVELSASISLMWKAMNGNALLWQGSPKISSCCWNRWEKSYFKVTTFLMHELRVSQLFSTVLYGSSYSWLPLLCLLHTKLLLLPCFCTF